MSPLRGQMQRRFAQDVFAENQIRIVFEQRLAPFEVVPYDCLVERVRYWFSARLICVSHYATSPRIHSGSAAARCRTWLTSGNNFRQPLGKPTHRKVRDEWGNSPGLRAASYWLRFVLRHSEEAVIHVVRVNVESRDRPLPVVGHGVGALAGACARARSIEGGYHTVGSAQEAVSRVVHVNVLTHDRPLCVVAFGNGALAGACARAPNVNRNDAAVGIEQEAMIHFVFVNVVSRARPLPVNALAQGALAGACARERSLERGDTAVGIEHEAVIRVVRVNVVSRARP